MFDFNNANELIGLLWSLKWRKVTKLYPFDKPKPVACYPELYEITGLNPEDMDSRPNWIAELAPGVAITIETNQGSYKLLSVMLRIYTKDSQIKTQYGRETILSVSNCLLQNEDILSRLEGLCRNLKNQDASRGLSGFMDLIRPLAQPPKL